MIKNRLLFLLLFCGVLYEATAQVKCPAEIFVKGKINVFVFLSTDCPISQKYMGTLNEMAKENNRIHIVGIIPGALKRPDLRKFRKAYQAGFSLITDSDYRWTDWFGAGFTPEVFVFNAEEEFIYQGAIDNWFYELGNYRQQITENYLRDIIAAELDGKHPSFKKTETIGCIIQKPVKR